MKFNVLRGSERIAVGLMASILWAGSLSSEGQSYVVTDLGALGGNLSGATAVNNVGVVAGYAATAAGLAHAVTFSNNILSDLGTLGGVASAASDINELGQVVGWANLTNGTSQAAFLYIPQSGMTNIGSRITGSINSIAHAINNAGAVVGEYQTAEGRQRPFLWANGVSLDLGFEGAATCINESGQIGGYEILGEKLGFVISGGQRQYVGTLGGGGTEVTSINTNGIAVGRSISTNGFYHAFAYQDGIMRDLGTFGGHSSAALGINSGGHIVGWARNGNSESRAFIYRNGHASDLNSLLSPGTGWVLVIADAINDSGQIAGIGEFKGETHGFLLTPNFLDIALYPGLNLSGRVGRSYRIEFTDGLSPTNSWQALTNLVLPASPYFFLDPHPVGFANRIYRMVLLPP